MNSGKNKQLFNRHFHQVKAWLVLALIYLYSVLCRRTVLVVAEKYGRLGNRIYLASHIMAFSHRGRFLVLLPTLEEYADWFQGSNRDLFCRYPTGNMPVWCPMKIFRNRYFSLMANAARYIEGRKPTRHFKTIRISENQELVLGTSEFVAFAGQQKVVFLCGWRFHDFDAIIEYGNKVRTFFQPLPQYKAAMAAPINALRSRADIIIGIAIRHGDYRSFQGGRYFFCVDGYVRLMHRLSALFPAKKTGFYICSDEDQDTSCFNDLIFFFSPCQPFDLFHLALCDFIVSPPSSFAGSAAFLGNVPLLFVKNIDDNVALSDFGPNRLIDPS